MSSSDLPTHIHPTKDTEADGSHDIVPFGFSIGQGSRNGLACFPLRPPTPSKSLGPYFGLPRHTHCPDTRDIRQHSFQHKPRSLPSLPLASPDTTWYDRRNHSTEDAGSKQVSARHVVFEEASSQGGFWSGRRLRERFPSAASLHSRSSSMKSSLRDSRIIEHMELNDTLDQISSCDVHEDADVHEISQGLPPPPVNLIRMQTFTCDICGEVIGVKRRREWQ